MIDQFLLYDQALLTWINNNLIPLIPEKATQLLVAVPKRAYANALTGRLADNETLTLPRISVTRLDHIGDPARFNSNKIRRLGQCETPVQSRLRKGRFPAPIQLMYQVDLWTANVKEMSQWEQKILFEFAPQYLYLQVTIDDVWQNKMYPVFLEGAVSDNSDLEVGDQGDRAIRRTVMLRADTWLFDQDLTYSWIVKAIEVQWRDFETEVLFEKQFLPPLEVIATGDGSTVAFGPITLARPPALAHTVLLDTIVGGTLEHVLDDGAGNLVGARVSSGTINYTTGEVSITYTDPPDDLEDLTITYFTDLS